MVGVDIDKAQAKIRALFITMPGGQSREEKNLSKPKKKKPKNPKVPNPPPPKQIYHHHHNEGLYGLHHGVFDLVLGFSYSWSGLCGFELSLGLLFCSLSWSCLFKNPCPILDHGHGLFWCLLRFSTAGILRLLRPFKSN